MGSGTTSAQAAARATAKALRESLHVGSPKSTRRQTAGQLDKVAIADVMQIYLKEHAPKTARPDNIAYLSGAILDYLG